MKNLDRTKGLDRPPNLRGGIRRDWSDQRSWGTNWTSLHALLSSCWRQEDVDVEVTDLGLIQLFSWLNYWRVPTPLFLTPSSPLPPTPYPPFFFFSFFLFFFFLFFLVMIFSVCSFVLFVLILLQKSTVLLFLFLLSSFFSFSFGEIFYSESTRHILLLSLALHNLIRFI